MIGIKSKVRAALQDSQLQANLARTLGITLEARRRAVGEVENWDELRQYARQVKSHTLANLSRYLTRLESQVVDQGGHVLWADDAEEAVEAVLKLAYERGIRQVVKSKSMLGEEISIKERLKRANVDPVETDLGEYIVQLAHQRPSHLTAPALHLSRRQIGELFARRLSMPFTEDATRITAKARSVLREKFLTSALGITGANFGVSETGTLVVVENEGNVRLSSGAPRIHVVLMGIE